MDFVLGNGQSFVSYGTFRRAFIGSLYEPGTEIWMKIDGILYKIKIFEENFNRLSKHLEMVRSFRNKPEFGEPEAEAFNNLLNKVLKDNLEYYKLKGGE